MEPTDFWQTGFMFELPLTPEKQEEITSKELAKVLMEILIKNDQMPANERNWKLSYYPFQLSSIRAFVIIGHANPEVPSFARKWFEAIALLKSKAFIMNDPSQSNRDDFAVPTSFANPAALERELGAA